MQISDSLIITANLFRFNTNTSEFVKESYLLTFLISQLFAWLFV